MDYLAGGQASYNIGNEMAGGQSYNIASEALDSVYGAMTSAPEIRNELPPCNGKCIPCTGRCGNRG